ncbi:hypothetical protein CORC01_13207 [Colletotrichum orchidophilum]|uniref:Zn(2)-C6 fungal-type domain-containing protein n=1 Tax=Colletotrichum orchidophilum TaxID=1209926 RepID=A0A1G4AQY2_9PEZI|nr:uncharacterized protein CORC01_13207 [Colletotrichum orchidophilum]OHE91511.1 hypothetical protein CORC01_13207 [Colletotrichum orchidophilum]
MPKERQASAFVEGGRQSRILPLLPHHGAIQTTNHCINLATNAPSDAASPRKKRASRPKVRSGCITCKIRRVKCDERKPTCFRCEKADFECDGYAKEDAESRRSAEQQRLIVAAQEPQANPQLLPRPNGSGRELVAPLPVSPPLDPSTLRIDQEDVHYFDLFRHRLVRDLWGSGHSDAWSRVVFQESARDPCVQESLLAIGAISQAQMLEDMSKDQLDAIPSALRPWGTKMTQPGGLLNHHHRSALLHHGKAVSIYRQRIQDPVSTSPRSVIIMTLLLVGFEFISGNMKNVDTLTGTGMRLLENKISLTQRPPRNPNGHGDAPPDPLGVRDDEMEDIEHLLPCLSLMNGFTHFFNSHRTAMPMMNSTPILELPQPGVTVISKLEVFWGQFFTRAVVHIMRSLHHQLHYKSRDMTRAVLEQATFLSYIRRWDSVLDVYLNDPSLEDEGRRILRKIQIHRLLIHIVISCSLDQTDMCYDAFEADFRDLLNRIVTYLRDPGPISKVGFNFMEGLSTPLATIVAKCRNHELRMQAVHLLNNMAWWEGAWDGKAHVIGKSGVVMLEERGMDANGFIPSGSRWVWMSGKWDLEKRELVAIAVVVDLYKRDSPLDVKIESTSNTAIKATITNTGAPDLKVLKAAEKVDFDGICFRLGTNGLPEDAFEVISAGQTVFDDAGGKVDITAKGTLSFAEAGSTNITGTAPFSSNTLSVEVDGADASKVRRDFHENVKRIVVQSDCTGAKRTTTTAALSNCRALAAAAKMVEYFKSCSSATRTTVAGVFAKVATECGSTTSGVSKLYCTDIYPACSSGVIAYTLPSASYMVNCCYFFNSLTALSSTSHAQDRATTALSLPSRGYRLDPDQKHRRPESSCYGYGCVQSLTAAQNLNHADNYS